MKTIALRFSENFAPEIGTIKSHEKIIKETGYVWYGKLGNRISIETKMNILKEKEPKILLIHSGKLDRYWAYVEDIIYECPYDKNHIPQYYRYNNDQFKTWFKIIKFKEASKDIMSRCFVESSGQSLSIASKHSMSPYFKVIVEEDI